MKRPVFAWLNLLMVALVGCEPPFSGCEPPMDLTDDSVPSDGGADAGTTCPPGRVVRGSQGWFGPTYLWTGPNDANAPGCPVQSLGTPMDVYADLDAPPECAPCLCGPSTGTCGLPSEITASTVGCNL